MKGKKSYLVCLIAVVYSISGFFYGALDIHAAFQIILGALAVAGLRHGIAKSGSER